MRRVVVRRGTETWIRLRIDRKKLGRSRGALGKGWGNSRRGCVGPGAGRRAARIGLFLLWREVDLDTDSDNFLPGLSKKSAFLALEEARRGAATSLRSTFGGRRREESHELVTGRGCGETGT